MTHPIVIEQRTAAQLREEKRERRLMRTIAVTALLVSFGVLFAGAAIGAQRQAVLDTDTWQVRLDGCAYDPADTYRTVCPEGVRPAYLGVDVCPTIDTPDCYWSGSPNDMINNRVVSIPTWVTEK